jgi:hypothetical protein
MTECFDAWNRRRAGNAQGSHDRASLISASRISHDAKIPTVMAAGTGGLS